MRKLALLVPLFCLFVVGLDGDVYSSENSTSITCSQDSRAEVRPLGMSNRWIGGSYLDLSRELWDYVARQIPGDGVEWNWERRGGLSTNGLVATTWGKVTAKYYSPTTDTNWFYVDDGSHVISDFGDIGVLVYSDADVIQGDCVSVTGVAGVEPSLDDENRLVRVVNTRSDADVRILRSGGDE